MNQDMQDYLELLGATSPVVDGVARAVSAYEELGIAWEDMILSETVNDAGQRVWGSLWLFSSSHLLEARDVTTSENYDAALVESYLYFRVELKDFDWTKATLDSRMVLRVELKSRITGEIRASGKNCERLVQIAKKYVIPGLKPS